jgi:ABC-2 type transport system ATP-binding protein
LDKQSNAIHINGLGKTIGKKLIVTDISLNIHYGEVFGFLGANGAGKTTIMKMITGLIKPTAGEVLIDNIDVAKDYDKALESLGAIIENPELYKHLSGYRNLRMIANMYSNVSNEKIHEITKFVGLTSKIQDKVKTYSLGMRQRLGLAAALVGDPKILILDEPLNGLDPEGIRELRILLKKLAIEENLCILLSSHNLSEMELVCDRFAIIIEGKLIETKEIGDTNSNEVQEYKFEMLNQTNPLEIENILQELNLKPKSLSSMDFIISVERATVSKVINALVRADKEIVAVIPCKKSLEDYFLEKTEVKKDDAV